MGAFGKRNQFKPILPTLALINLFHTSHLKSEPLINEVDLIREALTLEVLRVLHERQ
jgi:hypothetical protein